MKNLKTSSVLFLLFAMISCDKEYNCECTTTNKANGTTSTSSYPINSTKKSSANSSCNSEDENSTSFTKECSLK